MRDLHDRLFWIAKEDEVKNGLTTDVYFQYTKKILENERINPKVTIEVFARKVDNNWGIVLGIYEVAKLLEGFDVNVYAMEEGEIFLTSDRSSIYEPIISIEANYADISIFENPILGFLCFASGIASKAARVRIAANDKILLSFGTRRSHPFLAPLIERSCYIAGFDYVSNTLGAKLMGKEAVGTMPHALILSFNDQVKAWKAFDKYMPESVKRIALIDTLYDEKIEAIMAYDALKDRLYGVRLDTPSSRRGNWRKIIEEVRWELSIRGAKDVKIFVSGGLDEDEIRNLVDIVDGFGVGTSVSSAKSIDFSFKIVEVQEDGRRVFRSKRGDLSGKKYVYRKDFHDIVTIRNDAPEGYEPLLKPLIEDGKIVRRFKNVDELRNDTLKRLERFKVSEPKLTWI
ncbi:MAG: nicotinate phosphoribosyltransferase [Candidatus Nitrosocaldaceae archaeon]